jgi:hypothetical protein
VQGGFLFFFRFFWVLPPFLGGGWSGVATGYLHSFVIIGSLYFDLFMVDNHPRKKRKLRM